MLIAAAVIWGLAFVVMKDALEVLPTAQLLGVRFTATGLILAVVFWKRLRKAFNREHLMHGFILGIILFAAFFVQTSGLAITSPGKNAFLTAAYVVFVPFIYWVVGRKRPSLFNLLAALICIVGIGLVSLQDSLTMERGDAITVVGSFLFGLHIVYVARWSKGRDVLVLTVYQFISGGICGLLLGSVMDPWPALETLLNPEFLFNLGYLVIFASCMALVFQNLALTRVSPAQVSLFLSLEAVFGVIFSVMLYGETISLKLITGFGLIFAAILISEFFPLKNPLFKRRAQQKTTVSPRASVASSGAGSTSFGSTGAIPAVTSSSAHVTSAMASSPATTSLSSSLSMQSTEAPSFDSRY